MKQMTTFIFAMTHIPPRQMTLTEINSEVSMHLDAYCEYMVMKCHDRAEECKASAFAFNTVIATYWFKPTRIKERMVEARHRLAEDGW